MYKGFAWLPPAPQVAFMLSLTSKQRAHLRRLGHGAKPVVLVGSEGVTEALLASVAEAFNTRELVKVRLQESAPGDARAAADRIAEELEGVHPVQTIGRTAVLYRAHPVQPEIRLPEGS